MLNIKEQNVPKNILLLGSSSLLNDLSSEMITPILPLLITQLGGAGLAIGLIGGVREGFANILQLFAGYTSDKIGKRKIFIYLGYGTSAFFKLFLALAQSWIFIFSLVGLERIGKALRTAPRDALIAESSSNNKGLGFGVHRALDTIGAILGSLVVFFMLWHWHINFQTIILCSAAIALLSLIPLLWVQENTHMQIQENTNAHEQTPTPTKNQQTHAQEQKITFSQLTPAFKTFTIIASIFSLSNLSYMFFIIKAQKLLPNSPSTVTPILLYVLFNISYTIFAIPIGALSDKIGRWKLLVFGYFLFASLTLSFAFAQSLTSLILLFILYGITLAIIKVNHKAFASDLIPAHIRATALGVFDTITGIIVLAAGATIGLLWQYMGSNIALYFTSIVAFCAVTLLFIFKKELDKKNT
ncbi:MAG: MFS transporter [bacterium]